MTTLAFPIPRPTHPTGIWNWITTIDHKKIGILYGVTAFILFLSGGIEALLMRIQLAGPDRISSVPRCSISCSQCTAQR